MANLLEKLKSVSKEQVEETVSITIKRICGTSNPDRVVLKCEEGDFFCFKQVFADNIVPNINKPIKAEMLLREKGEYVNVVSVTYDVEQLGKYNLVASFKNPVVL